MRRFILALALVCAAGAARADEGYSAPWRTFRVFDTTFCLGDVPAIISCDVRLPTAQLVPEEEGRVVLNGTTFCFGRAAKQVGCDVRVPPEVSRPRLHPDRWVEGLKSRLEKWEAKAREINDTQ